MITAIEGGINYWAADVEVLNAKGENVSYQNEEVWGEHTWMVRGVDAEDPETTWSFTRADFLERIPLAPVYLADWLAEGEDADTADALIQNAAFGTLVYG
jgi:hypothetical protein